MDVCQCLSVCMPYACRDKGIGTSRVTGDYEPLSMGSGNQTHVLDEQQALLKTEPSLLPREYLYKGTGLWKILVHSGNHEPSWWQKQSDCKGWTDREGLHVHTSYHRSSSDSLGSTKAYGSRYKGTFFCCLWKSLPIWYKECSRFGMTMGKSLHSVWESKATGMNVKWILVPYLTRKALFWEICWDCEVLT